MSLRKITFQLNHKELGYIAGMIDGEGTLTIMRKRGDYLCPVLWIANTNKESLEWIKRRIQRGFICSHSKLDKCKELFRYELNGRQLEEFLPSIKDLLIIKQKQCLLILEFLELTKLYNRKGNNQFKKDKKHHPRVLEIFKEIRELNEKGAS